MVSDCVYYMESKKSFALSANYFVCKLYDHYIINVSYAVCVISSCQYAPYHSIMFLVLL